jgi:preprotein translocase subunit SecY
MFQKIKKLFQVPDLRNRVLFVLAVFGIFRLMANIPMPGFTMNQIEELFGRFQMLKIADLLVGGTLDQFSIIMLGLGPYITGTIIIQLLTIVWPKLKKMYREEGDAGRQKVNQYGRMLTVPFAYLQGYGMLSLFQYQEVLPKIPFVETIGILTIVAAGTVFLMWLGELVTEKGIGNGISLIIFAGIVAAVPSNIGQVASEIMFNPDRVPVYLLFFIMVLFIIYGVVHVNEARRNIPISYAKQVKGKKVYGGASTYLPLSLNPSGVIPIIFAMSIVVLPSMLLGFLAGVEGSVGNFAQMGVEFFQNTWVYGSLIFIFVGIFTYFYTAVTFDPNSVAENLQKMGGFIPGIRPGISTSRYLTYILNRTLLVGALFLGTVAVLPMAISSLTGIQAFGFLIGGAALIIIVSVVITTGEQINAQLQMREYDNL